MTATDRRSARPTNTLPRWFVAMAAGVPAAFLTLFYIWPFGTLAVRGARPSTLRSTLGDATTWQVLWFTTWQAILSTFGTVLLGIAAAWAISRFDFPGRRFLAGTLAAVFVLPTVVVGAAFAAVLPPSLERSVWAILGAHIAFNLAVIVRLAGGAWQRVPRDLEHAAATLGASPWATFRSITWPIIRPAVVTAASVVFVFCFTSFGVIRVLGTANRATIEVEVWRQATQIGDIDTAAALSLLQLAVLIVIVGSSVHYQRRHAYELESPGTTQRRRPVRRERWALAAIVSVTSLIVVAPLIALVERSFRSDGGYSLTAWRSLGNNEIRPGLRLGVDPGAALIQSATTAGWATLFAVIIGGSATVGIVALGRAGVALDAGLTLPLGTSAVTIGFGMLITFDRSPVDWRGEWWLVPVGQALVAVPFVVRATLAAARSIPADRAHAAATLGASPVVAWLHTTLPAMRRPMAVAAGLACAISLGEFGATSFLSRTGQETLPVTIERLLGRTGSVFQAQAFALSTILAVTTVVLVGAIDRLGDDGN